MADSGDEPGPNEQYCSSCGEIIKEEAEICPECGVRQKPAPGGGINVVDAISYGVRRALQRNGLILISIWTVLQIVSIAVTNSFGLGTTTARTDSSISALGGGLGTSGLTLPLPDIVLAMLWLLVSVAGLAVTLVAIRVFVSDETETIPDEFYQRNLVLGVANLFVGMLVFVTVVIIGLFLFIIPAIFLLVSLIFYQFYIAVEDENFIDAMVNSWDLARGHRLEIFLVLLVAGIIFFTPGVVLGFLLVFAPVIGEIFTAAFNGFTTVFTLAALAHVFRSLTDDYHPSNR